MESLEGLGLETMTALKGYQACFECTLSLLCIGIDIVHEYFKESEVHVGCTSGGS